MLAIKSEQTKNETTDIFLKTKEDAMAILQLKDIDKTTNLAFCSYAELRSRGLKPQPEHYELIYAEPLQEHADTDAFLEKCFTRFNIDRPEAFTGHSMSISDIIAIRKNNKITCYYVNSIGFVNLHRFLPTDFGQQAKYTVNYIDGHDMKHKSMTVYASGEKEAIRQMQGSSPWKNDEFDHQIIEVTKLE